MEYRLSFKKMRKLAQFFAVLMLTACQENTEQGAEKKGLSTLVDRIKESIGFSKSQEEKPVKNEDKTPEPSGMPDQNTSKPMDELPVVTPSVTQADLSEREAQFQKFEEELFAKEDEQIQQIENEAAAKVDDLMKDERVHKLMQEYPDLAYEELPSDIYQKMMSINDEEEKKINQLMQENDAKLQAKAKELGIEEDEISLDERKAEKEKRIAEAKEKTAHS